MQRNEIHIQITEVAEKIATLNRHLSQSSKIMKAETDLMNVYVDELKLLLNELTNNLSTTKVQPQEIIQEVKISEKRIEAAVTEKKIVEEEIPIQTVVINHPVEPVKPDAEKVKEPYSSKSLNERFAKKTVDIAEKLQQTPSGKHLKDLISLSDKFMFVNELFQNDKTHFEEAIRRINDLESFDEAVQFIEQELKANFKWDKKQKTVEHFQQSIKKKFGLKN
jgi:chromosome segregation ATPase